MNIIVFVFVSLAWAQSAAHFGGFFVKNYDSALEIPNVLTGELSCPKFSVPFMISLPFVESSKKRMDQIMSEEIFSLSEHNIDDIMFGQAVGFKVAKCMLAINAISATYIGSNEIETAIRSVPFVCLSTIPEPKIKFGGFYISKNGTVECSMSFESIILGEVQSWTIYACYSTDENVHGLNLIAPDQIAEHYMMLFLIADDKYSNILNAYAIEGHPTECLE